MLRIMSAGLLFLATLACNGAGGSTDDGDEGEAGGSGGSAGAAAARGGAAAGSCASGKHWTGGNRESPLMHPGVACIDCHMRSREAPQLTIAGTVYDALRDADDCNGIDGTAASTAVVVTDAAGAQIRIPVNAAGNFYYRDAIKTPFHAKVVRGSDEVAMAHEQSSGDCNSCHTTTGAGDAPGRILPP